MLVRYYGHVGLPTGYGVAANETCMAMLKAGIDLEISTNGTMLAKRYLPLASRIKNEPDLSPRPDIVVVHTLPGTCGKVADLARSRGLPIETKYVAYTTWEGASAVSDNIVKSLAPFDEIWVPDSGTALSTLHLGRVRVVPHAYDVANEDGVAVPRIKTPIPPYRFYYIGAWSARKNVDGLIRAFVLAFRAGDNVELSIHAVGATQTQCLMAQVSTGVPLDEQPRIRLSTQRLSDRHIQLLHQEHHCFVTATRGEAWNIPAFDAMMAGRHIIAPQLMGSDDFLVDTTAMLYASQVAAAHGDAILGQSPDGRPGVGYAGCLTVHDDWREPDLRDLAGFMGSAYDKNITTLAHPPDHANKFDRRSVGLHIRTLLEALSCLK